MIPRLPLRVAVVGGGIAGLAAATVLSERGARVTLLERETFLGGRAGAWTETLAPGEPFEMERGFHAFFRHYHNLRRLLRRVDPHLAALRAVPDYPILGAGGLSQSFVDLPRRAPWNVAALALQSPHLRARDLPRIDVRAALAMLAFDLERTYARHDATSARDYLDSLRLPPRARRMLFDVFSHSFFNPEEEMSAAELLMMFHYYFLGNEEGLLFDVASRPFSQAFWRPLGRYLQAHGAEVRASAPARRISPGRGARFRVELDDGSIDVDALVLAVTVPALRRLTVDSPALDHAGFRAGVDSLEVTRPFAVWRLWLDRPTDRARAAFAGTTGLGLLDNISLYHLFEDESRAWAARHGGAVVELHAYAIPSAAGPDEVKRQLRAAGIVHERFLWHDDCPAFRPGSHAARPGVVSPLAGVTLAGDFVRLPLPSALMERAATSGMMAANHLLGPFGVAAEPIATPPARGLLTRGLLTRGLLARALARG
jgi:carotenoid phi-ring synthase / carotenoid chi-ring synthase